jgi:ABC-2 type transport system permease protein
MIGRLIAFEWKQRSRLISTYVYALILAAAGAFLMLASGGVFRGIAVSIGGERVNANSPYSVFLSTAMVALLGLLTIAAVFGQAAYRDFEHNTWPIIFTKNVSRTQYVLGRFFGAYVFSAVLFSVIGLAQWLASLVVAAVRPARFGVTSFSAYVWPYLVQVWPMLFFAGSVFFALAALTRKMAPVYIGVVVLVLSYLVADVLTQDVEDWTRASMLDPFAFIAVERAVRYWTPVERNRDLVSVWGLVGINRVVWTAIGALVLAGAVRGFRFGLAEQRKSPRPDDLEELRAATRAPAAASGDVATPAAATVPSVRRWLGVALRGARLQIREIVRSPIYWSLALSGFSFLMIVFAGTKNFYGTSTWPVTYQVLENARGSFRLFSLITITLYAGELVHRERDAGIQDVIDATPVPTWVMFWSKLIALWVVALSIVGVSAVAAVSSQILRGYVEIDLAQYVVQLGIFEWSGLALVSVLALALQVVLNDKYLGHFAMVLYFASTWLFTYLGIEERLVDYAMAPPVMYSDMNGYGDMIAPFAWFRVYWSAAAALLVVGAHAFWQRGRERAWRQRLAAARQRFSRPWRVAAIGAAIAFSGTGGFLFYATHIEQPYVTQKDHERLSAAYERHYKAWQAVPQPRIVDAQIEFDVRPEVPRVDARGVYVIENKSNSNIDRVLVALPAENEVRRLRVAGVDKPAQHDPTLGVRVYALPSPLRPGARADLEFDVRIDEHPFRHGGAKLDVSHNGTFVNNFELPILGYREEVELTRDEDRADYGLAPKQRMASRDDRRAAQNHYLRSDSDYVHLTIDVHTAAHQIPIAPGIARESSLANGRRNARFVLDTPVLNFFSVLSARYAVTRDRWRDVSIEIYHHPAHAYNLERMLRGAKDALEYCSSTFGPYQHPVLRIVEFPRYANFAQAFPGTVPYSESVGFIARVRDGDPDDINYPYYITAHEVAHQWWAHQVIGANVRGATMTTETLAQYSALMVMKHAYDPHHMRRFLKFELDRYLVGRATERERELPLAHNEKQPYIHYSKGSLAMYALQDSIGQDRVDRALRRYVEAWKWRGPPYSTAADLVAALREETPQEYAYLIEDLFETITLYDNRATSATITRAPDGAWDVTVQVVARKFRSDEQGAQTELQFSDAMDVGALDADGNAIFLERRRLSNGASEQRFRLSERPAKVGIDPLNKLIDRQSDDNVVAPEVR